MRAKRDYNLVVDGKYNRRAIMQRAYVYVRNYKYSLSSAMKMAWCDAHLKMDDYLYQNAPIYTDYPKAQIRSIHEIGYAMLGNRYDTVDRACRW